MVLSDGYIIGSTNGRPKRCGHCGECVHCIDIAEVTLPKGMTVKATILQDRTVEAPTAIKCVGLECGCYAKFHRQVSHIVRHRVASGHTV